MYYSYISVVKSQHTYLDPLTRCARGCAISYPTVIVADMFSALGIQHMDRSGPKATATRLADGTRRATRWAHVGSTKTWGLTLAYPKALSQTSCPRTRVGTRKGRSRRYTPPCTFPYHTHRQMVVLMYSCQILLVEAEYGLE